MSYDIFRNYIGNTAASPGCRFKTRTGRQFLAECSVNDHRLGTRSHSCLFSIKQEIKKRGCPKKAASFFYLPFFHYYRQQLFFLFVLLQELQSSFLSFGQVKGIHLPESAPGNDGLQRFIFCCIQNRRMNIVFSAYRRCIP